MAFPKRKNIRPERQRERELLVVVGSKNPVKVQCTENGFQRAFSAHHFIVEGLNINSEVSDQPFGDAETSLGAFNRAKNAKNTFPEADYWVGIEGGVEDLDDEMTAFAWVTIMDRNGVVGKSKTATFILPEAIGKLIRGGMELGEADDKVFDRENSKQGNGAVGMLTKGTIDRKEYYEQAVVLALIPFISDNLYT
ncbi:inosine/xanthosine triphosphatase [Echinicola vietnamensis]|uniref:Probable inosine/xanthosine triphosphatase n=1 Tax=Echinicola vietnamensis (strain DSM 17526 / LMG 23754 / KMM 6221) TaxID=926556 RepID=L0FUG3_ECHVK|nr:inosine/xanthosine triphosphatase [Echinicola vietnamensis]AGA77509.1 inosine/xanthosine triphosphatase [Echinicola vietnamensis DSM 17526]